MLHCCQVQFHSNRVFDNRKHKDNLDSTSVYGVIALRGIQFPTVFRCRAPKVQCGYTDTAALTARVSLWPMQSFNQNHRLAHICLLRATVGTRPPQVQKAEVCFQAQALLGDEGRPAAIVVGRWSVVQVLLCTLSPVACSRERDDWLNPFNVCHSWQSGHHIPKDETIMVTGNVMGLSWLQQQPKKQTIISGCPWRYLWWDALMRATDEGRRRNSYPPDIEWKQNLLQKGGVVERRPRKFSFGRSWKYFKKIKKNMD